MPALPSNALHALHARVPLLRCMAHQLHTWHKLAHGGIHVRLGIRHQRRCASSQHHIDCCCHLVGGAARGADDLWEAAARGGCGRGHRHDGRLHSLDGRRGGGWGLGGSAAVRRAGCIAKALR